MRNRFLHQLYVIVALAVFASAVCAMPNDTPDTRPRADDTQLREALQDIRQRHAVPGLAAAVFDRNGARVFAVGELAANGNPVTPESRFHVAQVNLLFNGLMAATLVADGSLPAEAELRRLAPEVDLHNPWSGERPVRVEDLLSHRAGLGATRFRDVYAESSGQPLLAGINRAFRALRLTAPPGESERYSVVGHAIVAYLIEKAAGMAYEDALRRLLFQPLEMEATLGRQLGPESFDSEGHSGRPPSRVPELPLNLWAGGDLWISAKDLARVGQLLLNEGRKGERQLVSVAALQWMESAPTGDAALVPGHRRGVEVEEFDGFLFFTQTGALPGFVARFAYSRELGKGYLVLLNHGDATGALADAEALLRGQAIADAIAPPVPAAAPEALDTDSLTGWYRNVTPEQAPREFYLAWFDFAHAAICETRLCFSHLAGEERLEAFDDHRLRAEGRWYPGWSTRNAQTDLLLETQGALWQRVAGWQVLLRAVLAVFAISGLVMAFILLPAWTWSLLRRRIAKYHELVPRLLPLSAVFAVFAFQVTLFTTDYPALGIVSPQSIAVLVLSLLAPVLAVLSLPAAIAGFFWGLSRHPAIMSLYLSLVACVVVLVMAMHGLIAFQTWNY